MAARRFDLIISGGGIVGFSLLNLLKKSPRFHDCRILLLEKGSRPVKKTTPTTNTNQKTDPFGDEPLSDGSEYSNRVSSITPSSRQMLEKLEVWRKLAPHSKDVKMIRTWNYCFEDKTEFRQIKQPGIVGPAGEGILFNVVENDRMLNALVENLKDNDSVTWNSNVESSQLSQGGLIEVLVKNRATSEDMAIETPLLIGCDGFKSSVRKFSGLKYFEKSLNKSAVVGTVEIEQRYLGDPNDVAYQRFSVNNDTVVALLPLTDRYSSFVISAPNSLADHLSSLDEQTFVEYVNQLLSEVEYANNFILKGAHDVANMALDGANTLAERFLGLSTRRSLTLDQSEFWAENGDSPPRIKRVVSDSRASYPLYFGTTSPRMVGKLAQDRYKRIALIGDAAHRLHPLAGQGLNLGLIDALVLYEQLDQSLANGESLFNTKDGFAIERALHRFECRRQANIIPMLAAVQAMPTLFALCPSKGLSMIDSCNLLKESAVRFAN